MFTIYKQRIPIAGAAAVIVLGGILSSPRWRVPVLVAVVSIAALAIPSYLYLQADKVAAGLGGSLTMRQMELDQAVAFLNAEPWRWITGVGSATRIGDVTLADLIGARAFYLADLGWLGVTFEYGVIGVMLLVALHIAGLRLTWKAIRRDDPLSGALFDYVMYIILASPITSVVLSPGELLTCMAMAWYMIIYRRAEAAQAAVRA
jgi:O-antigen ligase